MPEPTVIGVASTDKICARCNKSSGALAIRNERLCKECFLKYVGNKLTKKLEMNKIRGGFHEAQKTLLLPVNFDLSSICLLHALDEQLQKRLDSGRHTGYTLHVLCIDESCIREDQSIQDFLPLLKDRFPNCMFSVISLADGFSYGIDLDSLAFEPGSKAAHDEVDETQKLRSKITSLPSASSKADVVGILRRRLVAAFARQNGSSSILYSDSSTKLAERTLSETAKGRGGALPWLTSDNSVMDGVPCSYPLRDLLQKELVLYADIVFPSLAPMILPADSGPQIISSKSMTIDGLMSSYFESLEESFPSIVANVVRTSSKLAPRSDVECEQACDLCKLPIDNSRWDGEQRSPTSITPSGARETQRPMHHCSGCARTLQRT